MRTWQVPVMNGPFTFGDLADGQMKATFHIHVVNAQNVRQAEVKAWKEHDTQCAPRASRKGPE